MQKLSEVKISISGFMGFLACVWFLGVGVAYIHRSLTTEQEAQVVQTTPPPVVQATAPTVVPQASGKLTCPEKKFPSCAAARKVFFQMKNNRYFHGEEAACRHAAAGWFLDDLCGGPG
jgi:hypothetical protein